MGRMPRWRSHDRYDLYRPELSLIEAIWVGKSEAKVFIIISPVTTNYSRGKPNSWMTFCNATALLLEWCASQGSSTTGSNGGYGIRGLWVGEEAQHCYQASTRMEHGHI